MPTYHGSCHCGRVRFEVDADVTRVLQCNCSHCSKAGWLLLQVPPERFRLLAGQEALRPYQFNTHHILHQFCADCGIHPFSRPADAPSTYMVNVRCLDDYDVDAAAPEIVHFDGRSR
jgi:hypothetical protein